MNEITEITRRAIIDYFIASGISWSGRLEEADFLSRLYDLSSMPSTDRRLSTAAGDIAQHRTNWRDWEYDWVFYDARFRLLHGSNEVFVRFLCETVHPAVRPDSEEARMLVDEYNRHLGADGWSLVEVKRLSNKPIFGAQKGGRRAEIFEEPTGWVKVDRQIQEV
jgi:AbiJ N-terminal domain 3